MYEGHNHNNSGILIRPFPHQVHDCHSPRRNCVSLLMKGQTMSIHATELKTQSSNARREVVNRTKSLLINSRLVQYLQLKSKPRRKCNVTVPRVKNAPRRVLRRSCRLVQCIRKSSSPAQTYATPYPCSKHVKSFAHDEQTATLYIAKRRHVRFLPKRELLLLLLHIQLISGITVGQIMCICIRYAPFIAECTSCSASV